MIKPILHYPNDKEILSQISENVTDVTEIKELIQDLKDTLHSIQYAHGLSAIQIGVPKRVCICSWADEEVVLINPTITRSRGQQEYLEGCLSVPFVQKKISRAQKVWCTYLDENGNEQEIAEGGRMSDIIQHELDHLNGQCKLFEEEKNEEKSGN